MIYPELDQKGRLHYHGTVVLTHTQKVRFYKFMKPKLEQIGYVDFNLIVHPLEWHFYCRKEWYTTKQILNQEYPISSLSIKAFSGRSDVRAVAMKAAKQTEKDQEKEKVSNPWPWALSESPREGGRVKLEI